MKIHDWQGLRRLNRRPEDIKRVDEEVAEIVMFANAAVNEEIEAIAQIVESDDCNERLTVNAKITIAAAIRARKRIT